MLYDAFICHASEDKETFVRPLAEALSRSHLHIWYDEFSLSVGDSLRRAIDNGLAKSRFGIVVLSPHFLRKGWPQRELDGLVARQISEDRQLILPIWHNISVEEIIQYSPPLADSVALMSRDGTERVCQELIKKLRPDESPLIAARDELLRKGIEPPVISDEWWLDIIEASNRIPNGGIFVPPETCWGAWTFPLPHQRSVGSKRGLHLAWTALQLAWSEYAEENLVCQITEPSRVHDYIRAFPGLEEIAQQYPDHLACYAPQLTIPEFSGVFSTVFDRAIEESVADVSKRYEKSTSGKIDDHSKRLCADRWALRHPTFGNNRPSSVACFFVQGELHSPTSRCFEIFEYLIWLLTKASDWLPPKYRDFLIVGIRDWDTWWSLSGGDNYNVKNSFLEELYSAKGTKSFNYTKRVKTALEEMIENALVNLQVDDSVKRIANTFIQLGFAEAHRSLQRKRTK